jgi:lipopolysaccharide O-acetyltransferase
MPKYSLGEMAYLGVCLVRTRLSFRGARLIRFPMFIKGKNSIDFGRRLTTGVGCRLEGLGGKGCITFGKDVEINDMVHITGSSSVILEDNVLVASKVYISDTAHGNYSGPGEQSSPETIPNERPLSAKPVRIRENAWLGESVSVLPGVTIGRGCVIGANSVVTKSVPDHCLAAGVPARVIKRWDPTTRRWEKANGEGRPEHG